MFILSVILSSCMLILLVHSMPYSENSNSKTDVGTPYQAESYRGKWKPWLKNKLDQILIAFPPKISPEYTNNSVLYVSNSQKFNPYLVEDFIRFPIIFSLYNPTSASTLENYGQTTSPPLDTHIFLPYQNQFIGLEEEVLTTNSLGLG